MTKKGQITFYLIFIAVAFMVLFITAFVAPFGVQVSSAFYAAGHNMMLGANESISHVSNPTIRNQIQTTIQGGLDAEQENIDTNTAIYKYGWIFVLSLAAIVTYLYTRRLSEYQQGLI